MKQPIICSALVLSVLLNFQTSLLSAQETPVESVDKVESKKDKKKDKDNLDKIEKTDKHTEIVKYRRGSLHTMIIEDAKLPKIDVILTTFYDAEFPDKYNNHTVGEKSFNLAQYSNSSSESAEKDLSPIINNYLEKNNIANKIVAKWFNRSEEGAFDMNLIGDRGSYDASAQDAAKALSTERGTSMLADAGEELIPNTFVVVNYSKFVSNEVAAKAAYDVSVELAKSISIEELRKIAIEKASKVYEKARQGYSVWTTAYLYQLEWTDSMSAVFYQDLWMDTSTIDPAKKEAFDTTTLFKLKLLGFQKASSLISGLGENAKEGSDMIIKNATLKSIDAVYVKLQRKFEPFRTKTPLVSVNPIGAKIGLKEGLEAGDKFEVLEQSFDAEGRVTYKRKGVVKVEKGKIWNNMFNAGETPVDEQGNPIEIDTTIEFTHFKGGKGYYPGMLLRQID
jgi:hypothetical protein